MLPESSATAAGASICTFSSGSCCTGSDMTMARELWGTPSLPLPPSLASMSCGVSSLPVDANSSWTSCCKRPSASSNFPFDELSRALPKPLPPLTGAPACTPSAITFAFVIRLAPPLKLCIDKKDRFLKPKMESVPDFCHLFFSFTGQEQLHSSPSRPLPDEPPPPTASQCLRQSGGSSSCLHR